MTLYFAYGSNMDRAGMRDRCPRATAVGTASLVGWAFVIASDGYASVVPARGGKAYGVLWDVTPRDLAALDAYESLASGLYARRRINVRHDGVARSALIYLARGKRGGRPRPGYLEQVIAAAKNWELPQDYVRALEKLVPSGLRAARAIEVGEAG